MTIIKKSSIFLGILLMPGLVAFAQQDNSRPNILFAIADDASYPHMGAYGTKWVETPAFDRVAEQGILFMNGYTPNAKCAPSRAVILTGRNSWQLEEAGNHNAYFPAKFVTYPEVLENAGYTTGYTGKPWAPGDPGMVNEKPRKLIGKAYEEAKTKPPAEGISATDYAANFEKFLKEKSSARPFAFWYGGHEPHRRYEWQSGIYKGGKQLNKIQKVPNFLPDHDTVRTDILDYAYEIEHFDKHLGRMLKLLEERGELQNTLVVVTADNGMPFPRIKGQEYEFSNHLPLTIMWPKGIKNPGRKVNDFISFIDFAPTFLEVAGVTQIESGMQPITGISMTDIFNSTKAGRVNPNRNYVLIGKERHDVGRPHDRGYPTRGIVTDDYLYLHNFKTGRWPAGNPETGYLNTDGSPTKTWILNHRTDAGDRQFWQWSFGKRVADELYDLNGGMANINNLSKQKENSIYRKIEYKLKERLFQELRDQGDPRMFGNRDLFDEYPYANKKMRGFYEKFMDGELKKSDAGWVNPSDFKDKNPIEKR